MSPNRCDVRGPSFTKNNTCVDPRSHSDADVVFVCLRCLVASPCLDSRSLDTIVLAATDTLSSWPSFFVRVLPAAGLGVLELALVAYSRQSLAVIPRHMLAHHAVLVLGRMARHGGCAGKARSGDSCPHSVVALI